LDSSTKPVHVRLDRMHDRSHDIVFADLGELPRLLAERKIHSRACLLVTDANVARLHGSRLEEVLAAAGRQVRVIVVEPGEQSKSMAGYAAVVDEALSSPIDRDTPVLAFGGGVVGDLAGFLAATLLRGLPFVQVPTSLVAQVDSAIGGKTGINHANGKNLVGAFYQPRLVAIDVALLGTLPASEWLDGLSEVVKYGLIADETLVRFMSERWEEILGRDPAIIPELVRRCVEIKADVVSHDETEQGLRAILNFGHTFGHALERVAGYRGLTHGQAVALGMRAALHLSAMRHPEAKLDAASELVERIPVAPVDVDVDTLIDAMATDKKRKGKMLRFILLREVGRATVEEGVTESDIRASWRHALGADTAG